MFLFFKTSILTMKLTKQTILITSNKASLALLAESSRLKAPLMSSMVSMNKNYQFNFF